MFGITYQKNKKIVIIEFHLGEINLNSIYTIDKMLRNYLQKVSNLSDEIFKPYMQDLNQLINSKYYIVVPVYAIDGEIQENLDKAIFFSKFQSPSGIEAWCKANLNQFII